MGLAAALGLFASIVVHELCHSLVARRYGLPMKGITLFLFGGVAEMEEEPPSARAEFMMAVAGPLASLVVAGAFLLAATAALPDTVKGVLRWIGYINLILVAFNLIPGFPLDGGRMLRAGLWRWKGDFRWATRASSRVGAGFGALLIGLGILNLLLLNPVGGLWWILIGMFIRGAAKMGYQQLLIRKSLEGEPVRRFMNPEPRAVSSATAVEELVEDFIYRYHHKLFPVVDEGTLTGCVTTKEVKEVPREAWAEKKVGEISSACSEENTIAPEQDAVQAFTRMSRNGTSRLMVVDEGRLVGIISLKDLLRFLAMKLDLEEDEADLSGTLRRAGSESPLG
jgi:Zn-dependent protease